MDGPYITWIYLLSGTPLIHFFFQFASHEKLVELSVILGSDFTRPYMQGGEKALIKKLILPPGRGHIITKLATMIQTAGRVDMIHPIRNEVSKYYLHSPKIPIRIGIPSKMPNLGWNSNWNSKLNS